MNRSDSELTSHPIGEDGESEPANAPADAVHLSAHEYANLVGQMDAIRASLAVVEFEMDGTVMDVNENFLAIMGYRRNQVVGQHHRIFVDPDEADGERYREFWATLRRGQFVTGDVRRRDRDGRDVWLQASYSPILDSAGQPLKVVKYATDITVQKQKNADYAGQMAAISKSLAVIEFEMDGTIIEANDNFLRTMGYLRHEVIGRHHRMFVAEEQARSTTYRDFWAQLNRGEYVSGEVERVGKFGAPAWWQASYNPIFDLRGRPFKVVKYAYDITAQVETKLALQRRVDDILATVAAVAAGDLTVTIADEGEDATAAIRRGLRLLVGDLRQSIAAIAGHAQTLGAASEELTTVSEQMATNAEQTYSQASSAARSSERVSNNVDTVAMGAEEFSTSIREVASSASEASRVAAHAVTIAAEANENMVKLSESSGAIGQVIRTITAIAQQTKMLALNATIEAARAGDAGRGFAVVANEVKELAKETSGATEDISRRIVAIQSDTSRALAALDEITRTINDINDIQQTIASSVEEQTATAAEIGRNVADAARGSSDIASNIAQVSEAAQSTTEAARSSRESAIGLASMAADLQGLVGKFSY